MTTRACPPTMQRLYARCSRASTSRSLPTTRESAWETIRRRSIACGSQRAGSAPSSAQQPPGSRASGPSAYVEKLGWLADVLGSVRDLDVLDAYLRTEIGKLDPTDEAAAGELVERVAGEREAARSAMLVELSSERYFGLLGVLDNITATPPVVSGGPSLKAIAGREFAKLQKTILRAGPRPSDEQLHRVRIRGKRARYAAELAEPLAGKRARRFVQEAKRFQDVVGEHQDAVVAEERIRALAGRRKAGLAFAAGRLVERQGARRAETRAALPAAWARPRRKAAGGPGPDAHARFGPRAASSGVAIPEASWSSCSSTERTASNSTRSRRARACGARKMSPVRSARWKRRPGLCCEPEAELASTAYRDTPRPKQDGSLLGDAPAERLVLSSQRKSTRCAGSRSPRPDEHRKHPRT